MDEDINQIKTTSEYPNIHFLPRRVGLGYKIEYKSINKSQFKTLINKKNKKLKLINKIQSDDKIEILKRGKK